MPVSASSVLSPVTNASTADKQRGKNEDDRHEIGKLRKKQEELAALFPLLQRVPPVLCKPTLRLRLGKPALAACRLCKYFLFAPAVLFHSGMV